MQHRRSALCTLLALLAMGGLTQARAEFPDRTVRIVVPFAPGGGTDLVARTLAAGLTEQLGRTVIVDNKPGAGTIIGSQFVAAAAPDGYTLLMATFAHAVNPSLQKKLPYDTLKAFVAVSLVGRSNNVLVVRADSPLHSAQEVIAAAKASPGKLSYASQGIGTSAHLAGELFTNLAGVTMTHVPYRGAGPALTDVMGGQVDMMFATSAAVAGLVAGQQLRALAVTAPPGQSSTPGVPSLAEVLPGYAVDSWYGLYAPAGTPPAVIARLNDATNKAVATETFQTRVKEEGLRVAPGSPEALDRLVEAEVARWRKIVTENGITLQ